MAHEVMSEWRSAWWDGRLDNWALWTMGADSCGLGSATDGTWGGDCVRPPQPLVGEALDTNALIIELPSEQHTAVRAWYVWVGTFEDRARILGIHRNTLRNRVDAAKAGLDAMWWAKNDARRRVA